MTRQETDRKTVCDTRIEDYKHFIEVNLRYGDTDRQGHVNNAVYCTLFESGRVAFLFDGEEAIAGPGKSFVIAKLTLDYLTEMNFPGIVQIASRVISIGRSSFVVGQAAFKDGQCCSTAESVIVLIDESTRRSSPITQEVRLRLESLIV